MVPDHSVPADNILKIFVPNVWVLIFITIIIIGIFFKLSRIIGDKIETNMSPTTVLLYPLT